ncbi:hypothetical protein GGX14DRAFT_395251 [Mycena pura]|uniref:Uncharacterized protein n=1 Tax=Mycena pura TaxID=153505 RepID=A0AAD6VGN2_9AGAR|nr:hypothetical protein GGX14DRAFT_395251 [Mycena pura]
MDFMVTEFVLWVENTQWVTEEGQKPTSEISLNTKKDHLIEFVRISSLGSFSQAANISIVPADHENGGQEIMGKEKLPICGTADVHLRLCCGTQNIHDAAGVVLGLGQLYTCIEPALTSLIELWRTCASLMYTMCTHKSAVTPAVAAAVGVKSAAVAAVRNPSMLGVHFRVRRVVCQKG